MGQPRPVARRRHDPRCSPNPSSSSAADSEEGVSKPPDWVLAHLRPDNDPLSMLTVTRAIEGDEEEADVAKEALRAYREVVGLPEGWAVHVEVAPLVGPANAQDTLRFSSAFACIRPGVIKLSSVTSDAFFGESRCSERLA